jgi:hypothetical protein
MLSGISSLEWKWVKNAGQHLKIQFIGAQKTANLACDLCKLVEKMTLKPLVK